MIMSFQKKYLTCGKTCKLSDVCAIPTQPNLSITPAKMAELADQGIPVSSALLSVGASDGVSNPDWDMPIDQKRGVDIAQVWEAQRSARKNITSRVTIKSESDG